MKYIVIILIAFMLTGCDHKNNDKSKSTSDISTEIEIPAQNPLEAIYYNGKCYYGIAMAEVINEEETPIVLDYIGTISSIIDPFTTPDEELESTIGSVGDELYHYIDKDGKDCFCTPIPERLSYYRGIFQCTTEKPDYYK